ncbi:3-dehydroquinate synthase [Ornithinibacillus sp. 179-J 7C1 HS]|uniref:3-dehydroquinate synthase n=1 Tax=Ornithinibacillus sp. 179-J 7C1 HS TaxID=3142384 RepID=UPI0039A3A41F
MQRIHINSAIQSYDILIAKGIRLQIADFLSENYSSVLIITDSNVGKLYVQDYLNALKGKKVYVEIIDAGEHSKNIETFYSLQTKAIECGLDRKSLIIALGGGVVGDLAGFVAATFMRGIDYIQAPTSILAHDSSVGGKVAINHEKGKNLIGSFYPPILVLYDTETFETLPQKEIRSGYAELIKEALLSDNQLFKELVSKELDRISTNDLAVFIEKGIAIKAKIVEFDEKESGIRKYLNLGHTLGHALETKLGYGVITHGEAIAIGLLFSMYVSEQEFNVDLPYKILFDWLKTNRYPMSIETTMVEDLIELMKYDKKNVQNQIQMVLLRDINEPILHTIEDGKVRNYLSLFVNRVKREVM